MRLKMPKAAFRLPTAHCLRCGHTWSPRIPHIKMCAKCKSLYWNVAPEKTGTKKTA
jgi:hypothetical protein